VEPQIEENATIAEVEDLVSIPEIVAGTQNGPDFAGSESAVGYAPVGYDGTVVNEVIIAVTPNTSLDLAEQQMIETNLTDGLLELPRAYDMEDFSRMKF
jgi:hypothetical protein